MSYPTLNAIAITLLAAFGLLVYKFCLGNMRQSSEARKQDKTISSGDKNKKI